MRSMLEFHPTPFTHEMPTSTLTLGPRIAVALADGPNVPVIAHASPVHCVLIGRMELAYGERRDVGNAFALPPLTQHRVLSTELPRGMVVYLDSRRYRFEDAQRLAQRWRGFVPGEDDAREAFGDALKLPRRRLDARLERMLDSLDLEGCDVREAA